MLNTLLIASSRMFTLCEAFEEKPPLRRLTSWFSYVINPHVLFYLQKPVVILPKRETLSLAFAIRVSIGKNIARNAVLFG